MVDRHIGSSFQSMAIYPSRFLPYIALLVASKFFRSFGVFLSYDLLKLIHVVQLLFLIKAGSSVLLLVLQKPFSQDKAVSKNQWFRICRHALVGCVINILWLYGLTLCGPLRTLLLYEHSSVVVIACMSALFTHTSTPARFRGAVFFTIAIVGILLFDHDHLRGHVGTNPEHQHISFLTHLLHHITTLTGLSDHKGGVVLLFVTLCLQTGYSSAAKKLSVDIGGAKRLNALSTFVSTLILLPWAFFISITRESAVVSWPAMLIPLLIVVLFVFVVDYYVDAICMTRLEVLHTARFGSMATFTVAVILSFFWDHPFIGHVTNMRVLRVIVVEDHLLSGGAVFSFVLFMFATYILTSPVRGSRGSFIGFSSSGLPLYSFSGEALQKTSQSLMLVAKHGLKQILEDPNSKKIFYFLCINLVFAVVELTYGVWTNSLGLISDGFHMLFDCSALVMGLYAAVMTHWKPTRIFSYGFDRVEILSGFINALFLVVISFFVLTAGLGRLFDPPDIHTERLLAVSVAGFLVNMIGIFSFSHAHSHGGQPCPSQSSHGHSHGSHGHSHGGQEHGEVTKNTNMEGVFLHVLADTLGSVGVIISTLLIEAFGWNIADPICSLFIATLIFLSVVPLVKRTCNILLLRTPEELEEGLALALQKLSSIEGVVSFRNEHFWRHSSNVVAGILHVQVKTEASDQAVVSQVTVLFKEAGVQNLTIQVEKPVFFQHLSGLGMTTDQLDAMTTKVTAFEYNNANNFIRVT